MKENKVGVVILARYSSSRLPGKALKTILGKPVLAYILERVLQVVNRESVIIATSTEGSDNKIEEFSKKNQVECYRGSLENVSRRFYEAALELPCDYAVRINGDNIFLDQQVLDKLIRVAESGRYDFLSNVKSRTYPKGMSVEVVRLGYYEKWLPSIEEDENYREHVMLYLYNKVDDYHFYLMNTTLPEAAGIQLALDTKEDFERSSAMIGKMKYPHTEYAMEGIMKLYKDYEEGIKG